MKPAEERREPTPPESPEKVPTPQKVFSPKRALAAFKADLGHKKKVEALISSLNNLNDFIAESNKEEEYSPEKKMPSPVKKPPPPKIAADEKPGKLSVQNHGCVVDLKEIPVEKLEPTKVVTPSETQADKQTYKKRLIQPATSEVKNEHIKKRAGLQEENARLEMEL